VAAGGKAAQHRRRIAFVARFPQDLAIDDDRGVGPEDDRYTISSYTIS
jgi:hypothetical protein